MKKSSIFILIVSFILSIFLVSFFGFNPKTDQFTVYFDSIQFRDVEEIQIPESDPIKIKNIIFDENAEVNYTYFTIEVLPEHASRSDAYEFIITDGLFTFVDEFTGEEYPCAEIDVEHFIITFNCPCAITVVVRATDGSGVTDTCTFICMLPFEEE